VAQPLQRTTELSN